MVFLVGCVIRNVVHLGSRVWIVMRAVGSLVRFGCFGLHQMIASLGSYVYIVDLLLSSLFAGLLPCRR